MNTPHITPPTGTTRTPHRRPLTQAVAAALVTCSLMFSIAGPSMLAHSGASEKGPTSVMCRYWPRMCGAW